MEAYTNFAYVYDSFMSDIPYDQWTAYLIGLLEENGIKQSKGRESSVLELGCGTGEVTCRLAEHGYSMTGIDISDDMLSVAFDKTYEKGCRIIYSNQDMREFSLPGKVSAAVSICDSVNYITHTQELKKVFENVRKYLEKSGVFIFDMKTKFFYQELLGNRILADNRESSAYIWENYYDEDSCINEYDLSIFNKESDDLYRKYTEIHRQRAYDAEDVIKLADEAGMETVHVYEAFTHEAPKADSERLYFVMKVKPGIHFLGRHFG